MDHEQLRALIKKDTKEIIDRALHDHFISLGIDPKEPIERQKDFAFLRRQRKAIEAIERKALMTIVGTIIITAISLLWVGFKEKIGN